MRKLKMFCAAALLLGGVICANAQKDVTSQYITNATLSSLDGWTSTHTKNQTTTDPADAFTVTTRGNNTVGYATEAYAGWGSLIQTAYAMKQTITLPAGNYRLVNYSFFRQGAAYNTNATKSLAYLVAGSEKVALKTLGSITAAGYANSQAEGANCFDSKMYRNVIEFTIAADNTPVEIGIEGTFDEAKSWCIVGQFELFDLNDAASVSSPTDVTYAITNPGFEYRNAEGWTITGNGGNYANGTAFTPKAGIGFVERWASGNNPAGNGTCIQTLSNMPNGLYELSVYGSNIEQYNSDANGTGMYVTANNDQTQITSTGQFKVRTTVTDGNLTVGIKLDNCTGNWIAFDRFALQFYGDPLAAYQELLDAAVAESQNLLNNAALSATAKAAWQAVIDANDNDDKAFTQESDFSTAIQNLSNANTEYQNLATVYALWNQVKSGAEALTQVANDNASATTTLSNAIPTRTTAAEAAVTIADMNAAIAALRSDIFTFVTDATPTQGNKFNLTCLMDNPDVTGLSGVPAGWATEQDGGNFQVTTNAHRADLATAYSVEYWSANARANDKFALYNAVTLPEGTYSMNCYAFASPNGVEDATTNAVYFYANDTQGSLISSTDLAEASISFVNSTAQDVKIGLKTLTGNEFRWMGIGYVELYKVPAQTYTVNEDAAWDNTQSGAGAVTLTRTIKAGINTLVLPFSMTQAEVESNFGEGSKVYAISSYDATAQNITFTTKDGISANEPCLLKATQTGTSYELADRTIVAGEPVKSATNVTMTGSYAASITVPIGSYIISGDKIYNVDSNVTLKNTRAYITLASAGARVLNMSFDGETTTGIATLEKGQLNIEEGTVYDLSGRKVNSLSKGIYVVNGKKVIK